MIRYLLVYLFCLPLLLHADTTGITAMSYNIRYDNPGDGPNAWPKRKEWVAKVIENANADLIGLQEVLLGQKQFLEGALAGYGSYGVGRDDGDEKGEHCVIFYKKDRFELLDKGTFWLSKKPHDPGSKSWDASITRIASWVKLLDKTSGKMLYFFSTHFDHKGTEARYYSILLLKKQIREITGGQPVIVAGDFNFQPDSRPYAEINSTSSDYVLYDAFAVAQEKEGDQTCCGFEVGKKNCSRIDYVLVNNAFMVKSYRVIQESMKGHYPSDHLPVVCRLMY